MKFSLEKNQHLVYEKSKFERVPTIILYLTLLETINQPLEENAAKSLIDMAVFFSIFKDHDEVFSVTWDNIENSINDFKYLISSYADNHLPVYEDKGIEKAKHEIETDIQYLSFQFFALSSRYKNTAFYLNDNFYCLALTDFENTPWDQGIRKFLIGSRKVNGSTPHEEGNYAYQDKIIHISLGITYKNLFSIQVINTVSKTNEKIEVSEEELVAINILLNMHKISSVYNFEALPDNITHFSKDENFEVSLSSKKIIKNKQLSKREVSSKLSIFMKGIEKYFAWRSALTAFVALHLSDVFLQAYYYLPTDFILIFPIILTVLFNLYILIKKENLIDLFLETTGFFADTEPHKVIKFKKYFNQFLIFISLGCIINISVAHQSLTIENKAKKDGYMTIYHKNESYYMVSLFPLLYKEIDKDKAMSLVLYDCLKNGKKTELPDGSFYCKAPNDVIFLYNKRNLKEVK